MGTFANTMSFGSSETMSVLMPTVRVPPFFGV